MLSPLSLRCAPVKKLRWSEVDVYMVRSDKSTFRVLRWDRIALWHIGTIAKGRYAIKRER